MLTGQGIIATPTPTSTPTPAPTRTPITTPNAHADQDPDPDPDANSPNSNPDAEANRDTGSRHPGHHEHPQSDYGGSKFNITGLNFTAGSEVNLFVATRAG